MSIQKNRDLMVEQMKRLRGQLNEDDKSKDPFYFTSKVEETAGDIYQKEIDKAEKTALKKLMPVIKKLFIGQVIPDDYENPNNESGKTLKKVFINPDWGGHPTLWIEVQLTSGKILKLRYSL